MAETKDVLMLAVGIGEAMLGNGAEIFRVEDTVLRIINAYHIESFDIYVLTNCIFATANETRPDAVSIVRHVPLGTTHLGRIAALNQLTRDICTEDYPVAAAMERLEECKCIPFAKRSSQVFFCGLGCGCYAFLFGGSGFDAVSGFFIGLLLQLFCDCLKHSKASKFVVNIFGSALVTFAAVLLPWLGAPVLYDKIIIGCIMPLVPGIALTTSIRDFFNGDYLCGTIRMIDALLTSFCIAVGVGSVITVCRILSGGALL